MPTSFIATTDVYKRQHLLSICKNMNSVKKKKRKKRSCWVKPWFSRRPTLGASNTLLAEWVSEDRMMFKNHLRMDEEKFVELIEKVQPLIQKQDTMMRECIPTALKLQITLRYLATGDSFASLECVYRVPKTTISKFLPEVLDAIYLYLKDYIKVSLKEKSYRTLLFIIVNLHCVIHW